MDVGGGERLREHGTVLVRQKQHLVRLEASRQLDEALVTRPCADEDDLEVVQVAEEGDRPHDDLRVADVPRVHHDETAIEPLPHRPWVGFRRCLDLVGFDPVRDDPDPVAPRTLLLQPAAHRFADRHDPVGPAQVRVDQGTEKADQEGVLEPLQLDGDLREHVLADHDERDAKASGHDDGDVPDDRRVGHAEDDVGLLGRHRRAQRLHEVGEVVDRPEGEIRSVERRRVHTNDGDAVLLASAARAHLNCPVTTVVSNSSARDSQSWDKRFAVASTPGRAVLVEDEHARPPAPHPSSRSRAAAASALPTKIAVQKVSIPTFPTEVT